MRLFFWAQITFGLLVHGLLTNYILKQYFTSICKFVIISVFLLVVDLYDPRRFWLTENSDIQFSSILKYLSEDIPEFLGFLEIPQVK